MADEQRLIKIATEGAFPPWNSVDPSGNAIGFDVDAGKAICERAKLRCEFVTQAWDGIIPALTVGKVDAIMAGMSITDKRKAVIGFSEPYALTSNYFVVAKALKLPEMDGTARLSLSSMGVKDSQSLKVMKANLQGKIIGVQGSTNAESFVRDYLGEAVNVRIYDKQDSLNLDLIAGRIDAGLADYSVWKSFLGTKEGDAMTLYGPQISGGVFGPGVGIGLRKQDKELIERFNAAIKSLKVDGTLKALSLKWFGADLVSE
ncbi:MULTISPECIES: transporter substrate-binding domain-containing protein [Rhizobium/Agrobacterium group]|uniref:transporter substrate-binding domain-containing protein n=1 Tax=Rhizobium/Agrobacterium group TaxID=227290 RepID=UPI0015DBFC49|nr:MULTISPECIES: transporter substrate-binding domain-containing protein [Rhizobium/Agrobacterium group]BCH62548.1 nopaline-binding periplasmic protein [Agrobacterium vitis]BCH68026.1 nopaline-binding periplasmic protein [Agrobacterium vitis]